MSKYKTEQGDTLIVLSETAFEAVDVAKKALSTINCDQKYRVSSIILRLTEKRHSPNADYSERDAKVEIVCKESTSVIILLRFYKRPPYSWTLFREVYLKCDRGSWCICFGAGQPYAQAPLDDVLKKRLDFSLIRKRA